MRYLIAVCTLALGTRALAQAPTASKFADSIRVAIESAVDGGELDPVTASLALAERGVAAYPSDPLLQHYHAYALYRAGTVVFGIQGSDNARPYFDRARDILEPLVKQPTIVESMALLSSVYGMQIAAAKIQMLAGMRLGSKASEWMERAIAAGPTNPRVWLMRGISAFNTPGAFGGGIDKAESYLKKSLELFEKDVPDPPLPAWGRADAHTWLGQVYAKQNRRDLAKAEFDAARSLQPRNNRLRSIEGRPHM